MANFRLTYVAKKRNCLLSLLYWSRALNELINTPPPPLPRLGDRGLKCTFIPWQRPHFLLQFLISHSDWQASSEYPSQLSWSLAAQGPDQKFDTGVRPLSQNNSFPPTPNSHGPHSRSTWTRLEVWHRRQTTLTKWTPPPPTRHTTNDTSCSTGTW